RIARGDLDLVLLDRSLGDMEGLDILQQLRSRHSEVELPVVMVTASDDRDSIIRGFELGADDYLTKPLDSGLARAWLATPFRLKQLQRELLESQQRYALAVMGTNDGLWDWNLETSLVYYSPRWQAMLGFPPTEHWADPQHWLARVHPDDRDQV